jgi:transposase
MALSKEIKEQLKADFEAGEIPVTEIAKKHEVSRSTILRLSEKLKWKRTKRKKQKVKPKPPKSKGGRPEKYKKEYAAQATALCMLGFTNKKLASFFNVVESRIYDWKKRHPEFRQALNAGRDKAGMKMAVSLFQRGIGYSHPEEKIFCQDGEIIRVKTTKHYPPEYKSMVMWLKNKYPDLWREKTDVAIGDPDGKPIETKYIVQFVESKNKQEDK